jgi:hypothetical protein
MPDVESTRSAIESESLNTASRERFGADRIGIAVSALAALLLTLHLLAVAPIAGETASSDAVSTAAHAALPPHLRARPMAWPDTAAVAPPSSAAEPAPGAGIDVEFDWSGPTAVFDDGWRTRRIDIRPAAVEIDGVALPAAAAEVVADDAWIEYHRGSVVEWFADGPEGLVHGLTIDRAPAAARLRVRVSAGAPVALHADETEAGARADSAVLHYAGVRARDASGAELQAAATVVGTDLALSIDARDARYPVVIGPLRLAVAGARARQRAE